MQSNDLTSQLVSQLWNMLLSSPYMPLILLGGLLLILVIVAMLLWRMFSGFLTAAESFWDYLFPEEAEFELMAVGLEQVEATLCTQPEFMPITEFRTLLLGLGPHGAKAWPAASKKIETFCGKHPGQVALCKVIELPDEDD